MCVSSCCYIFFFGPTQAAALAKVESLRKAEADESLRKAAGTQFNCFTSTKVQILSLLFLLKKYIYIRCITVHMKTIYLYSARNYK
jgi:hypothetical protein